LAGFDQPGDRVIGEDSDRLLHQLGRIDLDHRIGVDLTLTQELNGHDLGNVLLRWIHVVAGVIWIGHLFFFNWVNGELAKTYDAETKKKVVPELMPRALFWFRWGAAYTWITGVLLLAMLYWTKPYFGTSGTVEAVPAIAAFVILAVLFVVYDQVASGLQKQPGLALWIWYALVFLFVLLLTQIEFFGASPRAAYIHAGAMLGTSMAANVWMRIWPAQKRIITAIKNGQAPDANDAALAGMRSKHNTYMAVPLLLMMLSVHEAFMGISFGEPWQWILGMLVVGYLATMWLYAISTKVKGF
jgi:uncharacterized membrane protein